MGCIQTAPVDSKSSGSQGQPYVPQEIRSSDLYALRNSSRKDFSDSVIPLTQVTFVSVIRDTLCRTEVTQVFLNVEDSPIECEYVFPVLQDAVFAELKVQTDDGTVLKAKIEDLEEAKERYSDAIASGNQAVMSRMETEDKTVLNVGNIAPKSKVKVTFMLIHPVECEGKDWLFVLPALLLPLFNLSQSLTSLGIAEDEDTTLSSPFTFIHPTACTYKMCFHLTIHSSSPITNCQCLSHAVTIENPAPHLLVTVCTHADTTVDPCKGFRVKYETADTMTPQVMVQRNPKTGEYAAMLSFIPPLLDLEEVVEDLTGTGEFILLLDRSGSMTGEKIEMAREATKLFVKSLPPGCQFNVISFGSEMEPLFPNAVTYSTEVVKEAMDKISHYGGDMGGTDILAPLQAAFALPPKPNLPRSIFLLTDGDVENPEEVIGLVEREAKNARVHTFGIGKEPSISLITRVAAAGNGVADFISNPAEIKAKVINVLQKSLLPALANNSLIWPCKSSQYPSNVRLPTCYFGEAFRVFAHFGTSPPPLGQVLTLSSCNSKTGQKVSFQVTIGPDISEGDPIHLLWAKQAIKELTYFSKTENKSKFKKKAIHLSKKYEIPSIYTAFLCVESRAVPVNRPLQLRKMPVSRPLQLRKVPVSRLYSGELLTDSFLVFNLETVKVETEQTRYLRELVETQKIEGNWSLSALSLFFSDLQCPEGIRAKYEEEAEDVWGTICAVLVLRLKYADEEGEWKLLANKAKRWLKARGIADVTEYSDQVSSLLVP